MPAYRVDINHIVTPEETAAMIARSQYPMHRALVAVFYLTGARPEEVLRLRRTDINIGEDMVVIQLATLKLGKSAAFTIRSRILEFARNAPFMDVLLAQVGNAPDDGSVLFPIGERHAEKIIEHLSEGKTCPYNFRHSRLTKLANEGASLAELMAWKGSRDARSVSPYLAGKPIGRRLKVT